MLFGLSSVCGIGFLVEFPPVVCLSPGRRDTPERFEESDVVEPMHPLQGGQY
jgi:hypothetical protein